MALKDKLIDRAQKFILKGQIDKAIAEYRAALDLDPRDITIRLRLGELFVKSARSAEAIKEYTEAAKANSQRGFYLKAIAVYKQIQKIEDTLELHYKLAELYVKQRLIADAVSEYGWIVSTFEKKGKTSEVMELLKKMVEIDPENVGVRLKLADLYQKLSFDKDALDEYSWIFDKLVSQGKTDRAEKIFTALYNSNQKGPVVLKGLAGLCRHRGDEAKFLKLSRELLHACRDSSDEAGAREAASSILEVKADDREALRTLGREKPSDVKPEAAPEEPAREAVPSEETGAPGHEAEGQLISWPEEEIEIALEGFEGEGAPEANAAEAEFEAPPEAAKAADEAPPVEAQGKAVEAGEADALAEAEAPAAVLAGDDEEVEFELPGGEDVASEAVAEDQLPMEAASHEEAEVSGENAVAGEPFAGTAAAEPEQEPEVEGMEVQAETPETTDVPAAAEAPEAQETLAEAGPVEAGERAAEAADAETAATAEPQAEELHEAAAVEPAAEPVEGEAAEEAEAMETGLAADEAAIESPSILAEPVVPVEPPAAPEEDGGEEAAAEQVEAPAAELHEEALIETAAPEEAVAADEAQAPVEAELVMEEPGIAEEPALVEAPLDAGQAEDAEEAVTAEDLSIAITELMEKMEPEEKLLERLPDEVRSEERAEADKEQYVDLSAELGMEEALEDKAGSWGEGGPSDTADEFKHGIGEQLSKEDTETHYNLGIAYMEMELYGEASNEFKIALKDPRLEFDCYTRLGLCAMSGSRPEEAVGYYLKALRVRARSEEERMGMMYELALAYEAAGRYEEAARILGDIHEANPRYREVAKKFRELSEGARPPAIPSDDSMIEVELL